MRAVALQHLTDFFRVYIGDGCQFVDRGHPLVFLHEVVGGIGYGVQHALHIERQTHHAALLRDGLQHALAYPPHCIGDELEATGLVKLVGSLHQTYVALVDEVAERQTLVLVLLGDRYHEAQVGGDQLLSGFLALWSAAFDFLGEFYFLFYIEKGKFGYPGEVGA